MDAVSTPKAPMTDRLRRTFYRARRILLIAACVAPVLLLASVWWVVTQIVLVPRLPGATTPAERVVQFIEHPKGLPRLDGARGEAFLEQQVGRLVADTAFRDRFLAEVRSSRPDEQSAFRAHLFDTFKPVFMRDVRRFHQLDPDARRAYLDERIVAYNRLSAYAGKTAISPDAVRGLAPTPQQLLQLLTERTTEEERQLGGAYYAALQARVGEILADPELKADFEARIARVQR